LKKGLPDPDFFDKFSDSLPFAENANTGKSVKYEFIQNYNWIEGVKIRLGFTQKLITSYF
jgi:hypothetical protein